MTEIWKDIKGYEGFYQVSNCGKVKSLARLAKTSNGKLKKPIVEKTLKLQLNIYGYPIVSFRRDGIKKTFLVHGIVADCFIPNPQNKPTINHINGIKTDNSITNLEWNTYSENNKHAFRILGRKYISNGITGRTGKNNHKSKPVICLNTNEYFESGNIAAKKLGLITNSVNNVCNGKAKQTKGYTFKFAEMG